MLSGKEHLQSCSPPPCSSFTIIFQHPWLPLPWVRTPEEDIPKVTIFVVVHFPLYIARILAFLILLLFLWSFTIPSNFSVFIEFAILKYFLALIMSNLKSYFVSCFNLSSQAPSQPHLPSHFIIFFYFLLTLSNLPHISGIEFILTECTFPGASYIIPKSGMWWFFVYSSNARGVCLFFFFPGHCQHVDSEWFLNISHWFLREPFWKLAIFYLVSLFKECDMRENMILWTGLENMSSYPHPIPCHF